MQQAITIITNEQLTKTKKTSPVKAPSRGSFLVGIKILKRPLKSPL